jgi:hypothetical protein
MFKKDFKKDNIGSSAFGVEMIFPCRANVPALSTMEEKS